MLQNIRDSLTGPMTLFIVGIIVVPFAFFGIETFRGGGADPTVVAVGSCQPWKLGLGGSCQKITQGQFRAAYRQRIQQLQNLMGESFRPELIDQKRFRQTVLDQMVDESLMRQHTHEAGYRVSKAELADAISNIPGFQENGKFSADLAKSRIAAQGYSVDRFEQQMRDSLVIDQMREGVLASAFVAQAGVAQAYQLDQQQRWLAYATFDASKYQAQAQIDPAQVQKRYDEKKASYQAPERLRAAYLELSIDTLPPAPAPAQEYLKTIYDADKATKYSTPEERHARHILVNFGADKEAAKKHAAEIAAKLANGGDFASLAGAESADPGSKNKGGDLGWIRRGQMVKKFEDALFAMKKGETSEPVESEFGWHIIRLDDVHEAQTKAFDDPAVQADLLALYRRKDAEHRFQELSEKLEQTAFEAPNSLDAAAKATGLTVQLTDWFTRAAGAGVADKAPVREAAFSEEVLQGGENSKPVSIGPSHVVVVRKQEYEAAKERPLAEVAEQIKAELKAEAGRERAAKDAQAALDALAAGKPLEQVVTEKKAELKTPGLVKRDTTGIDPKVLESLFKMPHPAAGKATRDLVKLNNGNVVVLVSTAVQDADWSTALPDDRKKEISRLRESSAGAEFAAYRKDLETRLEVKVVNPPEADSEPSS